MRVHSRTETLVVLDQGFRGTVVPRGEPDRRPVEMSTATGPSDARLKRHALIVWSGSRLLAVWFHIVYQLVCPGEFEHGLWQVWCTRTGISGNVWCTNTGQFQTSHQRQAWYLR